MDCKPIKTFRYTNNKLANFSEFEEEFDLLWQLIKKDVDKGLELGWQADKKGKKQIVAKSFGCANYLFYLGFYGILMKHYNDLDFDNKLPLKEKFKVECVEKNLSCISMDCGIDLVSIWKNIKEEFGLNYFEIVDQECCPGIGDVIIDDPDDCKAFIIGSCGDEIEGGEFDKDDFNLEEFNI